MRIMLPDDRALLTPDERDALDRIVAHHHDTSMPGLRGAHPWFREWSARKASQIAARADSRAAHMWARQRMSWSQPLPSADTGGVA